MKKILFLIHDLGQGGAEKVLVNLVNNMDHSRFDVTVMSLFDTGENRQFLSNKVHYRACFCRMVRGNSHLMKLLSPKALHRWFVREHYDVEVAYLEGPCARIISGCTDPNTKTVGWIHIEQHTMGRASGSFRSAQEAERCYSRMDRIIAVSETVKADFESIFTGVRPLQVLYNTNESAAIRVQAQEVVPETMFIDTAINVVGVGKLLKNKGFDRLIRAVVRLRAEGLPVHLYLLGSGPEETALKTLAAENGIQDQVTFLGYQTNPYRYVAHADLFVCASHAEGFSTAATEALIVGTPVLTTRVSGMEEMLGAHNEYGVIVENDDEALYEGLKALLSDPERLAHYRRQAAERGKAFSTEKTVQAVEEMLTEL